MLIKISKRNAIILVISLSILVLVIIVTFFLIKKNDKNTRNISPKEEMEIVQTLNVVGEVKKLPTKEKIDILKELEKKSEGRVLLTDEQTEAIIKSLKK